MNTVTTQIANGNQFLSTRPQRGPRLKLILLLLLSISQGVIFAQVGIGNATPDTTAVLDLSNANNKGVVLPSVSNPGSFAPNPSTGMVFFSNDLVYYRRSDGFNALSPWKYRFNGNVSDDVYYDAGGNIGIGVTNLSVSPEAPLQVLPDAPISLNANGTFMIGSSLGNNLVINSGEIQARNTGSAAPLKINEDGGDITMGTPSTPVQLTVTGKIQEVHRPTGQFYDLITAGTIAMWYGDTTDVPVGWGLCNGNVYQRSDNSGTILAPDLRGRFIVGVGNNGTTTYAAHDTGGQDSVALAANELGEHRHFINLNTNTTGNHRHGMGGAFSVHDGNGNGGEDGLEDVGNDQTGTAGAHSHNVSGNTTFSGQGDPHENRPYYHALVFIIKL